MLSKHNISLAMSAAFMSKVNAGKCPFGFDSESEPTNLTKTTHEHPVVQNSINYPADIFTCTAGNGGVAIATTASASMTVANYKSIV